MIISKLSAQLASTDMFQLAGRVPNEPLAQEANMCLATIVAGLISETETIREVALLAHAARMLAHDARSVFRVLENKSYENHVRICQLDPTDLASDAVEALVHRTVKNRVLGQRFFFNEEDREAPMWRSIAALSVCSATGVLIFLQGPAGCGKTEAVRHFSANRKFNDRTPVYSVSCSA
jgi:hypothetical protein